MSMTVGTLGIPANMDRSVSRLRCPSCGGTVSRCRACGARFDFGAVTTCTMRVHDQTMAPPLFCRCGARLTGDAIETPSGKRVALPYAEMRAGDEQLGRLRGRARMRFGWLMRATGRRREPHALGAGRDARRG